MPARWTIQEEKEKRKELASFYIFENRTIGEIADILEIQESTVFGRLRRLGIPIEPWKKDGYLNKRKGVNIPSFSRNLAEFIGVMLGDGHISNTQIWISSGENEKEYHRYLINLAESLFSVRMKSIKRTHKAAIALYMGSVEIVQFLLRMGLVHNKVREQVQIPPWIMKKHEYAKGFLRGFFDTDGSVYKLRFGVQMGFCNRSLPLLFGTKSLLDSLGYSPSEMSSYRIYLTRKADLMRYASDIGFGNLKHLAKARKFGIIA